MQDLSLNATEALAAGALRLCAEQVDAADLWLCNEAVRNTILDQPGWAEFAKQAERALRRGSGGRARRPPGGTRAVVIQFHDSRPGAGATFAPFGPLLNKLYFERQPGHTYVLYHRNATVTGDPATAADWAEGCPRRARPITE